MKHILDSQAGVTVLEGVIALGLLALITAGAFGVLLSGSRQATADIREEMTYAVEKASDLLKVYVNAQSGENGNAFLPDNLKCGLCGKLEGGVCKTDASNQIYSYTKPLTAGMGTGIEDKFHIKCLLPPVCDPNNSEFFYKISSAGMNESPLAAQSLESPSPLSQQYRVAFTIQCNGYEL